MNKIWQDHAEFLGDLTDQIIDVMVTNGQSLGEYTEWLAKACFKHAEKHCREDFGKVADEPLVDDISVSGDRAKREGPSWDKDKKGWNKAKREPVDIPVVDADDDVIETQEECGRRFAHCENCD